jgi:hypothetical protein
MINRKEEGGNEWEGDDGAVLCVIEVCRNGKEW